MDATVARRRDKRQRVGVETYGFTIPPPVVPSSGRLS